MRHIIRIYPNGHKNAGYGRFEATRRIRSLSKTIPIIALTAFAFEREKEIAKQCEFTDYVVKPIDIKELKKLIAKVLA